MTQKSATVEALQRQLAIEQALERVRARSLEMKTSDELSAVLSVLFQQFDLLGISPKTAWLTLWNPEENTFTYRSTGTSGKRIQGQQVLDIDGMEVWRGLYEKWKTDTSDSVEVLFYAKEDLAQLFSLLEETYSAMPGEERLTPEHFPEGGYSVQGHCKFGYIGYTHTLEPSEEDKAILTRFATEFGRVYQRFLDIEKAEAQAREAQIEAALERVRARSMAMRHSTELGDVAEVLFDQMNQLLGELWTCGFVLCEEDRKEDEWWLSMDGGFTRGFFLPNVGDYTHATLYEGWAKGDDFRIVQLDGDSLQEHYDWLMEIPAARKIFDEMEATGIKRPEWQKLHAAYFSKGYLCIITEVPCEEEAVFKRFAQAFDLAYTRFLDLQKAEAQAREAEIEAALERVRAKTMAMHNTNDIADTVVTFFEELLGLGLDETMRAGIGILSESEQMKVWTASVTGTSKTVIHSGFLSMSGHPLLRGVKRVWSQGEPHFTYVLEGEDLQAYFRNLNEAEGYTAEFNLDNLPETIIHRSIPFTDGVLFAFTKSPLPQDIIETLERFAAVFGQTYTRYLDLQKAEERARESRIEAALERVRAKALAMHSSEDLRQTITAIFEELKNLNVKPLRMGLGLLNPEKPEGEIITSRIDENDEIIEISGKFDLVGHAVLDGVYEHFKKQRDYFPVLEGDEINSYYAALTDSVDVQGYGTDERHYGCFLFFKEGGLYAWAAEPHSGEQISILKKFSRVVEITYRRYNDLIESEAREKEAVKQASLDRVRAEIASMRTAEDLERITPLIWKELTTLGIPFFRCGVFIMDEPSEMVHVYLTTPEGKALAAMDLPYDFDMSLIQKGVEHWRKQEPLIEKWDQEQFIEMTKKLMEQGRVKSAVSYQAGEAPPERLVLHQVPFAQGMLYVGSAELLSDEEMDIVQVLTRTFAVAYARYEDFRELEKAKEKVENTLADLKATQAQLIQSEKMASLGELTAGIAHEIKNPLNFVNNFSEVSRELLEELMEEMEKGDLEEVRALAGDVTRNLEKIVHHGQRADSIVKGMLQHSRSGDGQKEATDLNELADEYLRLAYHGLRARDKSFNAHMETDFDASVGQVDLIPQDIGRVLLNLVTNAFYAVNERKASAQEDYKPTVWVRTQKTAESIEIAVKDNGGGIPDKIVDKIFQPFFTTKPTGQGTGLGLSLSYDIVKAHGGELHVETREGEGTIFRMRLKSNA